MLLVLNVKKAVDGGNGVKGFGGEIHLADVGRQRFHLRLKMTGQFEHPGRKINAHDPPAPGEKEGGKRFPRAAAQIEESPRPLRQPPVKIVDDLGHVEQTAVLFVRVGEAVVNLS